MARIEVSGPANLALALDALDRDASQAAPFGGICCATQVGRNPGATGWVAGFSRLYLLFTTSFSPLLT